MQNLQDTCSNSSGNRCVQRVVQPDTVTAVCAVEDQKVPHPCRRSAQNDVLKASRILCTGAVEDWKLSNTVKRLQ